MRLARALRALPPCAEALLALWHAACKRAVHSLPTLCLSRHEHHTTGQFKEGKLEVVDDDFYSPVQPKKYIKMRIEPSIEFYRAPLPTPTRCKASLTQL